MKRLAVLTLMVVVYWGATDARAADPLPPPTGFAPTTPRVPAPALRGGAVVPVAATTAPTAGAVQVIGFHPGMRVSATDGTKSPQVWCNDCASAVRHPLPPVPVGGSCATGTCAAPAGGHDGHCWNHFKAWLGFRNTPVHLGLTPTPRITPFYTYFPCNETAGCASGNCGPRGCASSGHPRLGVGACAVAGCTTCPQPGEAVMPGYRLAAPTASAPRPAAPTAASQVGVLQTGFRIPPHPQTAAPAR